MKTAGLDGTPAFDDLVEPLGRINTPGQKATSYRGFTDTPGIRMAVLDGVKDAYAKKVAENKDYQLRFADVDYSKPKEFSLKDEKEALLNRRRLYWNLHGRLQLVNKATGEVVSEDEAPRKIAEVPWMSRRGTWVHNGTEYLSFNQMRLKPGAYTRQQANGDVETQFNVLKGSGFRVRMTPDTGVFRMKVGQSELKLYPVLKALGVGDKDLMEHWGRDLLNVNRAADDKAGGTTLMKLIERLGGHNDQGLSIEDATKRLPEILKRMEMDPGVTKRTLGQPYTNVDPGVILAATKKILGVHRGEIDADERDDLPFQSFHGPEDFFREHVDKDAGQYLRQALFKSSWAKDTKKVPDGYFTKQLQSVLMGSGLAASLSEINPLEIYDMRHKITRMGEGGISSADVVPQSARGVQPTHFGFIDPVRAPESQAVALDLRVASGAKVGSDGRLYQDMRNARTGAMEPVTTEDIGDKVVAFPGELKKAQLIGAKKVSAMVNGKMRYVPVNQVDYELPYASRMWSPVTNMVPYLSGSKGQRVSMGSRMMTQALALRDPEAPLVRTRDPETGRSLHREIGKDMGAVFSEKPGTVVAMDRDSIVLQHADGTRSTHELYDNFPLNQKGFLHNTPVVHVGQQVGAGDPLARSNYTNAKGESAIGRNVLTAFHAMGGLTHEDAVVISESAAKKFASEQMYEFSKEHGEDIHDIGKNSYVAKYGGTFNKEQLDTLDDNGVVKVGTVLRKEDPIILAVGKRSVPVKGSVTKGTKSDFSDAAETWEHDEPGEVVDVRKTPKGFVVSTKSFTPVKEADKLCYSEDTEVLTWDGWKPVATVTTADRLASLGPCGSLEYLNPVALNAYTHTGRMYSLETTQVSLLVTDNHHLYANPRNGAGRGEYGLHRADALFGKTYKLKNNVDTLIPGVDPGLKQLPDYTAPAGQGGRGVRIWEGGTITSRCYAFLLGAFLSEGCVVWQPDCGNYGLCISQTKPEGVKKLLEAFAEHELRYTKTGESYVVYGKALALLFSQFAPPGQGRQCHIKRIPDEVWGWTPELQFHLFDWLIWGDGSISRTSVYYTTVSPGLAGDMQRLALHLGFAANIRYTAPRRATVNGTMCDCRARYDVLFYLAKNHPEINHGHHGTQKGQKEVWAQYSGRVYCPTLPRNHVLYVRRKGKAVWCGNSGLFGNKGIVAKIVPDAEMLKTADGRVIDVVLNPAGIVSRVNPSQLAEAALGKIAQKFNKTYDVDGFPEHSIGQFALDELKKHGMSDTETITDPRTGRQIKDVFVGVPYFMKLHHMAEGKMQARDTGGYDLNDQPAKGGSSGCFVPKQRVLTSIGYMPIATICEKRLGVQAFTWSAESGWGYRPVTDWFTYRAKVSEIKTVEFVGPSFGDTVDWSLQAFHATPNHRVYLYDGRETTVGELKVGDSLVTWGVLPTADQWSFLYGTMLGDASCIPSNHFSVEHSVKQIEYVNWKQSLLASLGATWHDVDREPSASSLSKIRIKSRSVHFYSPAVQEQLLADCYPDGTKHITEAWLARLTDLSVVAWFLDDGCLLCRTKKKGKPRYEANFAVHSFSREERVKLCDWLSNRYGPHFRVDDCGTLSARKEGISVLVDLVARYVPVEVIPKSKRALISFVAAAQEKLKPAALDTVGRFGKYPLRIRGVRPYVHDKPGIDEINVYDFTVDGTHKYCAGPALVSNSKRIGLMEVTGLVSHGATDFLEDMKLTRGQRNDDYWRLYRMGLTPPAPRVSKMYQKFEATLQGAGVHLRREGSKTQVLPMTQKDVEELTGTREVTVADTVDFDNGDPVKGGLFDVGITGGKDGGHWSHIKLAEPMPNPVVEDPIRSLLGLTKDRFRGILGGTEDLNGLKGPRAIQRALEACNVPREIQGTIEAIKSGKRSQRDKMVKRLGYLKSFERMGISPGDLVMSKVPVLPPKFRPITQFEGRAMSADANYLYKDLLEANHNVTAAKETFGDYDSDTRLQLYDAFKAVTGLGGPVSPENQERNVKGLLKQVTGTSPKFGQFQRKVIGNPVDLVGRAVLAPGHNIDIDEVGLPVDMMWKIFKPFAIRRMARAGMPAVQALKEYKERSRTALLAMTAEAKERPVVLNRAPSLHKLNLTGHYAHPVAGHALKVSHLILAGQAADYDGDSGRFILELHVPGSTLWETFKGIPMPFAANTSVASVHRARIQDIPVIRDTCVQVSPGVTEYDVAPGVQIYALDPATLEHRLYPVTKFSVHEDLDMRLVTLGKRFKTTLSVSADHSLICYKDGKTQPVKPDEAQGLMVPVIRHMDVGALEARHLVESVRPKLGRYAPGATGPEMLPVDHDVPLSRDFGFFIGALVGDGWVDVADHVLLSNDDADVREAWLRCGHESTPLHSTGHVTEYDAPSLGDKVTTRHRVCMNGAWFARWLREQVGEGAKNKRLPSWCFNASDEHLMGVLDGLMSTDGCIGLNTQRAKPQLLISMTTISVDLVQDLQYLGRRLGFQVSVSLGRVTQADNQSYVVTFSAPDFVAFQRRTGFSITAKWKQERLLEYGAAVDSESACSASTDLVPYPQHLHAKIRAIARAQAGDLKAADQATTAMCQASRLGYWSRLTAIGVLENVEDPEFHEYLLLLSDNKITWKQVISVEVAPRETGYDLTVPGPLTFATHDGVIVQDTLNVHVPVSAKAVEDVKDKMMPSKMLLSPGQFDVHLLPPHIFQTGLYQGSQINAEKKPRVFHTKAEAVKAYRSGEIDADDPVTILTEK